MKDRQIRSDSAGAAIPLLSPILHVFTMPAIVLLRRNFGYLYLRPKSVFLSLCWAFGLFAVYSWYVPARWKGNAGLCWFSALAAIFYVVHLIRSVISQFNTAPHDQFSGKSWLSASGMKPTFIAVWMEPIALLLGAIFSRSYLPGDPLGKYLLFAGGSLWLKESINHWASLRKTKRQVDVTEDADETMEKILDSGQAPGTPDFDGATRTTRKPRTRRERVSTQTTGDLETHASILRMLAPYTLDQAEKNFRLLAKQQHPDNSQGDGQSMRQLTEARDFFRQLFADQ